MKTTNTKATLTAMTAGLGLASLAACHPVTATEYTQALPDRKVATIALPSGQSTSGLSTGTSGAALVGQAAEYYTASYYQARDLNALGAFIINLLETVASYPPTGVSDHNAVWGPFSDANEPNEWLLDIERKTDANGEHFEWAIAGKHKSAPASAYVAITGGAFLPSPTLGDGKGWFVIDFDAIHGLKPTETGRGRIAYAYDKNAGGVAVLARYTGPDATGTPTEVGYAYGESVLGEHYAVFAYNADIDDGQNGRTQREDVLIRTRWNQGPGRADVVAVHGDLGTSIARGSQCWDDTFVSTFESIKVDDQVLSSSGDASSCAYPEAELPTGDEMPNAGDVENPFPAQTPNE